MQAAISIHPDRPDPIFHEAVEFCRGDSVRQGCFNFHHRLPDGVNEFVQAVISRLSGAGHRLVERIPFQLKIAQLAGDRPFGYRVNVWIGQQPGEPTDGLIQFFHIGLNPRHLPAVEIELLLRFLDRISDKGF